MTNPQDRLESIIEKLRAQGYRVTPQRVALLEGLCSTPEHLSAAQLYARIREQFPTTSLATVYKTLAVLKDVGEVQEISFGGDAEAHYDGHNPTPHPHLICLRCEEILDADPSAAQDRALTNLTQTLARQAGYQSSGFRFDIYGLCPACQTQDG